MTLYLGKPSPKQDRFLRDTHRYVGYGGARGGGKSWAIRTKAIILALKHPGIRMLIIRRSFPELEANHAQPLRKILGPAKLAAYNESKKIFNFRNGSLLRLQFISNDRDLDKIQGQEYDVIFIDEATQLSEYQLKVVAACCRGVNPFPKRIYYTCNPGGQGHGYIKRVFIDREYKDGENPDDYSFIQALVQDNAALMEMDPDYIHNLEALPPKLKDAWLYGSWDIFEGQFFEDFVDDKNHYLDQKYTHVIEPFDPPAGWRIYRSFDWGYSKPFSCAWWAVDYDGRLYRILEWYGCTKEPNTGIKWTPEQVFAHIQEIEHQHRWLKGKRIVGVADPAIWDAERGVSIAETAAHYGIFFDKGDNARIPGWMQVHYRFQFDGNGIPMMYIFSTCKAFIRTIPLLMYDEHRPEDLDTSLEDHVADETRYMCMERPIKPVPRRDKTETGDDPLNQHTGPAKHLFIS